MRATGVREAWDETADDARLLIARPVHRLGRMTNRCIVRRLLLLSLLAACAEPRTRGVECIAPANPGGGWDLTCRGAGRALRDLSLVPGIVRVVNMPGAGGAIAYAHTVARRTGDENVLIAASPATTLRIAQSQFGRFDETDVRWVGAIAADYGVVAVNPASQWRTLPELVRAWQADPSALVVGGGSAAGGQDHMKMLVLARAIGIDPRRIRYVPFDGGGEAVTALLGNFIQVFSGDASEIRGHVEAGGLRVLAVFAPERMDGLLAGVPTAREQGVDVEWIAWRGFYAPAGLSESAYGAWVDRMAAVAASEEWATARAETGLAPFVATGAAFEQLVTEEVTRLRALSRDLGLIE